MWGMQLIWPWQDRDQRFSWLKAGTLMLMFVPAIWLVDQIATEQFGPVPLGGMTYWSGLFATALVMLALAICLFTALLEIGWIWAYQGYAVSEILSIYFTFDLGVPPALKILAIGLLIALGASGRHALRLKTANLKAGKVV
jgi:hypothetical protein